LPVVCVPSVIKSLRDVAPVPPDVTARAEARVRTPAVLKVLVAVAPKAAYEADSTVEEAFLNCCKPVQMFGLVKFKSALMVPDVVTGFVPPSVRVELGVAKVTEETVPERQTPLREKHPPVTDIPFAKVEVAAVPVRFRYVVLRPEAMVEVAFERMVVVAVPF
jgi:hypothetical protein